MLTRLWHENMKMKRSFMFCSVFFGIILFLSCFVVNVSHVRGNSGLIDRVKISGWRIAETPYHFGPQNLFEYINGAADFFLAYGFVSLEGACYFVGSDSNDRVLVDVYDMGERLNAFGVFQSKRDKEAPTLNIGAASFGVNGYLAFYKDRYFVEINSMIGDGTRKEQPVALARALAEIIRGDISPPHELSYFAEHGRIEGSERYIKGGILGHGFLDKGIVCDYRLGGETVSAFISFFSSERDGIEAFEQYVKFLQDQGKGLPLDGIGQRGLIANEPYHKHVLVVQERSFVLGVYDLSVARRGLPILKDITERLPTEADQTNDFSQ